jgi:phospholipid/cholesterol/gamma-HCH transport system substrate-binding protein
MRGTANWVKLTVFVVIGVVVMAVVGLRYADLGRYVGLGGYYVVHVELAAATGLFPQAEVTYRGVTVGEVGAIRLTDTGVEVDAHIDTSAPAIPANVQAVVTNRSVVGEGYLDLRLAPGTTAPARGVLADGDRIARANTVLPLPVTDLLRNVDALVASFPQDSLRTAVDELEKAFAGRGTDLQSLLDTGNELTLAANAHLDATTSLIENGQIVLATQQDTSDALASFSHNLSLLNRQLASSDPDLRRLLDSAPLASAQISGLLDDVEPQLSALLANLLTTADIALIRNAGIEQLLVTLPGVVAAGSTAIGADAATFGMVVTFFDPLPCTAGYEGTTYRNGLDTSPGGPMNTAAQCTLPASSGVNVRGSANAPR